MYHLLIFESNVKSSESWFLSGKILYFLGARVCCLLKIISWNVWKAVPVRLSPVWSSCVCDMLWEALLACLSHVNMFRNVFGTCVLVTCSVHIPVVTCSVSCWWPVLSCVWSSPVWTHLWHAQRHVLSLALLSCAVSSGVCSDVPSHFGLTWVRSCLPIYFESLHVRTRVLSCGQPCVVNVVSLLFVMCSNTCSGIGYGHVLGCCVLLLWIYHMFSHVSGYISSCGCNLFQPVLSWHVLL